MSEQFPDFEPNLGLNLSTRPGTTDGFEEHCLSMMANAYENLAVIREGQARLKELAATDQMLGILNKSTFEQLAQDMADHSARSTDNGDNMLLIIDIDHFKLVNDTSGHSAGDDVLKAIAGQLRATVRKDDLVGRIGGEEFGVLLHNTTPLGGLEYAERLREALHSVIRPGTDDAMTASIGIAELPNGSSYIEAAAAADLAMYHAKTHGRDGAAIMVDGTIHHVIQNVDSFGALAPPEFQ